MIRVFFIGLIIACWLVSPVSAHDTWVGQDGSALVVKWGHGDKLEAYKPESVKAAKGFDAAGQGVPVTFKPQEGKVTLAPAKELAALTLVFASGPWVKTPEGYKNVSKREAKDVIESMKGLTYNKNIWKWSENFGKPLGGKMEIVPLKNPLALKVGDKLPFQVLYDGKPLAGATVTAEGVEKDSLKTDTNGRTEVTVKKSGLNVVKANLRTPTPNDPDADILSETANLVFEVR